MKVLRFLLGASRWLLWSALLASVINGVLVSRIVALINRSLAAERSQLAAMGLEFALTALGTLGFRWFSLSQFVRLSQATLAHLRLHISRQIMSAPYRWVEARGAGRLLAVLTSDVAAVGDSIVILPWLFVHGVVLVGCLGHLLVLSWQAFLVVFGLTLLSLIGYPGSARKAQAHLRRARQHEDLLFDHFRALFSGAKELKLHAGRREAFLSSRLAPQSDAVRAARTTGLLGHTALGSARVLLMFALIGGVIFVLGPRLGLSPDVRSGYVLTLLYMMLPLNAVLEAAPSIGRMQVALERIEEIGLGDAATAPVEAGGGRALPRLAQQLTLDGVTHAYRREHEDEQFVLGPISLTLTPGEIVFVVGGNGSGKTTLAKLLVGLYEPDAGEIRVDGKLVERASWDAYRHSFSAVFSDFHVFETIFDGADQSVDARATELLEKLHLARKVSVRDGRLSTTALSSGQQKRLALLVAWLEDRPVYVFDEWAADQDPAYKDVFYGHILPDLRRRGKAVLVITHDDRYFHLADRCLKLEYGRLLDDGSHALRTRPVERPAPLAGQLAAAGEP